ncbi:MAG TPA: transketolase C-terminal domain-containing protein [Conexibacter sp.]|nr:transketolase C-terminal domain-containing protein [Conexibacter sp.]
MTRQKPRMQYFTRALNEALRDVMRADERVIVMGEDVDRSVSGATRGLIEEFGAARLRNTPISEATMAGAAVGAAMTGLRPVVDLMYGSFLYLAMDQVLNQAARWRYMSGGRAELPIVYMAQLGPSSSAAAQHSEAPHAMMMHGAGIKVVVPSTPADAKGLMTAAVRDPNPVVFFRDAALGGTRGPVPEESFEIPLGVADVKRAGDDVTVVAIASTVQAALAAAEQAAQDGGCSVEVIDPRTLVPLDLDAILASVARTGRLVVCDNGRRTAGAAAEIVSRVVEAAWDALRCAPAIVACPDVPMPFSPPLERALLVDAERVGAAIRQVAAAPTASVRPAEARR